MRPFLFPAGKKPDKAPRVSSLYMKMRSRFTVYFFLLVLLPYAVIAAAAYFHIRSIAEKNAYNLAFTSIEQEKNSIDRYIKDLKLAAGASAAFMAPLLESAAGTGSQADLTSISEGKANISSLLKDSIEKSMNPTQLRTLCAAYILNADRIAASYGSKSDSAVISSPGTWEWFHSAVKEPGVVHTLGTVQRFYAGGDNQTVFCMAEAISPSSGKEPEFVLLADFDYCLLSDFAGITAPVGGIPPERLIVDFEGNVLYSKDKGKLTAKADETLLSAMDGADKGFKRVYYGRRNFYMTYVRYSDLCWTFIDLNPASNVSKGIWSGSPVMAILIFTLPVILFVYFVLLIRLMNPINELTTVISDYEEQLPGVSGQTQPPVQELPHAGMNCISDIDCLINKIYNIKLRQKEAELNSLQNQINPHFLYNTLESIRGAALYHGIHDIAAMSKALSLLFRYSISDRVLVSIKEELQHLDNYMSIQNFRYENKFEIVYSAAPELMNYKILKLTLQPLIENSIKHGLEMKLGKGTIKVEILQLDNNIKIQISDDGLGMPPKKVEELNRAIAYDKYLSGGEPGVTGTGIGVKNVNSRIKLYFGEQYGLKFREAQVGTTVEITLPAVVDK